MIKFKNNMTKKDGITFLVALCVSAILFLLDLFTKNIIIKNIGWGEQITVIDGFFSISHVHNKGAAWGIFSDYTYILSIATIFASLLIIYLIYASTSNKIIMTCFTVILGGAGGNLAERIFRGYVTDFLSLNIFGYNFPSFNVADICITVGCFVLLFYIIFIHKNKTPFFRSGTIAAKVWGDNNGK